jgi:hypothetical protein
VSYDLAGLRADLDALPRNLRADLRPNPGGHWAEFGRQYGYTLTAAAYGSPYGALDACWGCGLEADAVENSAFRHPMFGQRPNLCRWCAELQQITATSGWKP